MILRHSDSIQAGKINGKTALNVGGARKGCMAAALNSKLARRDAQSEYRERDIRCRSRAEAACRKCEGLLLGPVLLLNFVTWRVWVREPARLQEGEKTTLYTARSSNEHKVVS